MHARALVLAVVIGCGSGSSAPDAGLDAAVDASPDALVLGPVQCGHSVDDCIPLTGSGCFQARPGGVCAGCGDPGDQCPTGTECITGGTSGGTECAFPCQTDADCNLGMFCVTNGPIAGHCQPRRCDPDEPSSCPYPYTFCRETSTSLWECARPRCDQQTPCPPPLVCPSSGTFCLEPR